MKILFYFSAGLNLVLLFFVGFLFLKKENPKKQNTTQQSKYYQDQVKNTIVKNKKELNICYQDFLKSSPQISKGAMKLDWQVTPNGVAQKVESISNGLQNTSLEKCTISKIYQWKFPPTGSEDNIYVSHNFIFGETREKKTPQIINIPAKTDSHSRVVNPK